MSKYERYKASGIEWMGNIPEPWLLKRTKHFYSSSMGETILNEDLIDDALIPVYSATESDTIFGYVEKASVILEAGDIIIPARGNSIGNIKLVDKKCTCTQTTIFSKQISKRVSPNFIFYYYSGLKGYLFQFDNTAIPQITVRQVSNNPIVLPTYEEQLTIANYLDDQTLKIDRLIANKKAQAEKLKVLRQIEINNAVTKGLNPNAELKDSGIDWLGKIPKHWELKRLKNLANQISEKSTEILDDDFLVALENIESNTGKFIETASEYENNGIKFKKGNLLYNKLRPYLNKVFQADKEGVCVGDVIVIECTQRLNPTFLQYRMLSDAFCSVIMASVYGAKMPRTSWQFISSLKIGYPSFDEQVQIAEHLNKRTIAIENLIQNINLQTEKLQELRKIKIYEAVTGKIKVNAYVEATA